MGSKPTSGTTVSYRITSVKFSILDTFFMPELEEFAEALLDQIAVETDEEKVIADLVEKIDSDSPFDVKFEPLEEAAKNSLLPWGRRCLNLLA